MPNAESKNQVHLLERQSTFEIVFCTLMLSLSAIFLFLLFSSHAQQQNTIFFTGSNTKDTFMDFFNLVKYTSTRDPYHYTEFFGVYEKIYPPLGYLILYPFSCLLDYRTNSSNFAKGTQMGIMSLFFLMGISVMIYSFLLYHYKSGTGLIKAATVFALFSSGIFFFAAERGNMIVLTAGFTAMFLFWYQSDNRILREFSYIALACAAATKVYPVILGVLLLKDRRWIASVRTILYGIIAFFLPFFFFTGGLNNFSQLLNNVQQNSAFYLFFSPSYRFGWLAYQLWANPACTTSQAWGWITFGNVMLVLAVALCLVFQNQWKTITLLTCAIIATPVNSAYYCGIYIFIPIVFFLNEKKHSIFDWIFLLLFAVVLNPLQFIVHGYQSTVQLANAALLMIYALLLLEALTISGLRLYKYISGNKDKVLFKYRPS